MNKYASFPFAGIFIIIITSQKDVRGKLLPVVRGRYLKVWLVYSGTLLEVFTTSVRYRMCTLVFFWAVTLTGARVHLARIWAGSNQAGGSEASRCPLLHQILFHCRANDTTLSVGLLYVVAKQRDRGARCSLLLSLSVRVACFNGIRRLPIM